MPKSASARRYAQAVFKIALERDELDRWSEDLATLSMLLEDGEFARFLDAPQVTFAVKHEAIRNALGGIVSPLAVNLLALLASRNLAAIVPQVQEQYQHLLDAHRGIARAEVVSAVPLSESQRRKIAEFLKGIAGKEVRLAARVEPQIIGGLVARVGDRVIDGSTRTRLQALRRTLVDGMA